MCMCVCVCVCVEQTEFGDSFMRLREVIEIAQGKYEAVVSGGFFCVHPEVARMLEPTIIKCYPNYDATTQQTEQV
jgi:hypothetical protein